jgi:hypothetical protein
MTRSRDIERVLDLWFEGVDRIPDRVIDRALENIERIPQRRAGRAPRRFTDMPTSLRLLGLAAALTVAGGAAYLVAGAIRPADAPGATRNMLDAPGATWSATRSGAFGHPSGTYEFETYNKLIARTPDGATIQLGPVISGDGTAVIGPTPTCPEGATYRYGLSADYLTLTALALTDSCTDRRALIEGDWDRLSADRGLDLGTRYTLDMGIQVSFTVPDWPGIPGVGPYGYTEGEAGQAPRVLRVGTDRPGTTMTDYELRLFVDPHPAKDVCDATKGVLGDGWTMADFADPARAGTMGSFSQPVRTTIGGHDAIYIDVKGSSICGGQIVTDQCCPDDSLMNGLSGRLWLVDVGGRPILVEFVRYDVALTAEQMAIGQALVDSLKLEPEKP